MLNTCACNCRYVVSEMCVFLNTDRFEDSETRSCDAVAAYRRPRRSSSNHIPITGINRRVTDRWIETKKSRARIDIASVQFSAQERGGAYVSGATGRFANRKHIS